MNTMIRNSLLAFAVVGALSLSACKTTDDAMDAPAPAAAPAEPAMDSTTPPPADSTTPPMDSSTPTDSTTTPAPTTP